MSTQHNELGAVALLSDGSTITVQPIGSTLAAVKTSYSYTIVAPEHDVFEGDDLRVIGPPWKALEALFSFLSAFAEAGLDGENRELFPDYLREWAETNADEFALLQGD